MGPLSHTNVATSKTVAQSITAGDKLETEMSPALSNFGDDVKDECDVAEDASEVTQELVPNKIVWHNVILYVVLHMQGIYGFYLLCTSSMWQTNLFAFILFIFTSIGVYAGAHRLWSHRSYKATLPLRVFLAFIFSTAFQNSIFEWARNHRVHHKYSETNADPHNAKRGFFFSHMGWFLCRKHPEVIKKGKNIDVSDLLADPVVRFNKKYYFRLVFLCCFVMPTIVPMYFWGETFSNAFFVAANFRFCFTIHQILLVNSAAHMWGYRPYDVNINPADNPLVNLGTVGEGFHNYHHAFPYDYASSEFGIKYSLVTAFIDVMAWFGLAYDRKRASRSAIRARKLRTGELSLKNSCDAKAE